MGKLLANPTYAGRLRTADGERDGQHTAIIDSATFDRAQALRGATRRLPSGGGGRPPAQDRFLFTRGLLTCGHCGAAMTVRARRNRKVSDFYICRGREQRGPDACPQTPIPRATVDGAVFAFFESVGLDVEATRASLAGAAQRQIAETAALRREAEHEVTRKRAAIARMDRDYEIGALGAENYERLTAKWAPELTAAQAQVARLREREAELAAEGLQALEEELLAYLAELRAAIAGQVNGASGFAAVRAAIVRLFEAFYIGRAVGSREGLAAEVVAGVEADARARGEAPVAAGEWQIIPVPRAEMFLGVGEGWRPILKRQGLEGNPAIALT